MEDLRSSEPEKVSEHSSPSLEVKQKQPQSLARFDLAQELQRIPNRLYFRIGEVAELLGVKPYVLRYWETEFKMVSPQKSSSGQRVYKRADVETVMLIKHLLYIERYSIEGAIKKIRELRRGGGMRKLREAKSQGPEVEAQFIEPQAIETQAAPTQSSDSAAEVASLRTDVRQQLRTKMQELDALITSSVSSTFKY